MPPAPRCSVHHMTCPSCSSDDTKVLDTRACRGEVVRRRACKGCGHRFTTAERITAEYLRVRKTDGTVESFSRAKLRKGIIKAAAGQKLSPADVSVYVDRVVQILQPDAPNVPIPSSHIGTLVLQQLHNDADTDVIRIRYAMVLLGRTAVGRGFWKLRDFLGWLGEEYGEPRVAEPSVTPSTVIKRNGKRESFELEKLARGIGIAAKGRGTDAEVRNLAGKVASAVQYELRGQALVTSAQIAGETLKVLHKEDPLAYLRYASAVKTYQSIDDFWMDSFGFEER